jgi:hypothetical protein
MRQYLAYAAALLTASLGSAIAVNLLIDPYAVHGSPLWQGINLEKPALSTNERLYKALLARTEATTAILGTSRSEVGLDPRSPAFGQGTVLNLATSNQPYRETLELLQEASAHGVRRAIVGLDFFAANDMRRYPSTFTSGMYSRIRHWELATSLSTLLSSYNTFRNQDSRHLASVGAQLREDGLRRLEDSFVKAQGGHYRLFRDTETSYLRDAYPQASAFGLDLSGKGATEMNCAYRLFEYAHRAGIELHIFISPSHARLWETLYQAGLWTQWEAWKRRLVLLEQLAARDAGKASFPIIDFSGFNTYTTEPVPANPLVPMQWYIEASHYRPALGELVLERLLSKTAGNPQEPAFGTELNPRNIEMALQTVRSGHASWRFANPAAVADIKASLLGSAMSRRRNSMVQTHHPGQGCQ